MNLNLIKHRVLLVSGLILIFLFVGNQLGFINNNNNNNNQSTLDFTFLNNNKYQQQQHTTTTTQKDKRIFLRNGVIDTTNSKSKIYNIKNKQQQDNNNGNGYLSSFVTRLLKSYSFNEIDYDDDYEIPSLESKNSKNHYIVQFKDHINDETRNELIEFLKSTDVINQDQPYASKIIHYIPNDSFLVLMTDEQSRVLSNKAWINWIDKHEPSYKLHLNYHQESIGHPVYILLGGSSDSLIQRWESTLNSMLTPFHSTIKLQLINSNKLKSIVSCKLSSTSTTPSTTCSLIRSEKIVYQWISEQPESNYIDRSEKFISANRLSPTVVFGNQNGLVNNDRNDIPLRGKGQIISIADTGLDSSHCFFSDSNNPIPFNTVNQNHRKVVTYITSFHDGEDYIDGHGTHVCGSAVGTPEDSSLPISQFSGLATDAKIAFFDLSTSNGSNVENQEPTPPEDYNEMYQPLYDTGARVHGDSWGSVSLQGYFGGYSDDAASIDNFLYTHDDFIILRAAGNNEQYSSLLAQATAKNVITIGAEQTSHTNYLTDAIEYTNFDKTSKFNIDSLCASFDDKYCTYTSAQCCSEATTVKGLSACCVPSIVNSTLNTFTENPQLFNENNICSFSSKGPTHDGRMKPDIVAPGEYITSSRSNGANNTNQCGDGSLPNTNALLTLSGTSMATPLATAATTILRQYLVEGYFPTGEPIEANKLIPTGSLMKALMINNAQILNGTFPWSATNTNPPNNVFETFEGANLVQGWGALRMSNWLYVKSSSSSSNNQPAPSRFIGIGGLEKVKKASDWKQDSLSTGQNMSYCFTYNPSSSSSGSVPKIVATLVWTDPPSYSGAKLNLVNNLDMTMTNSEVALLFYSNSGGASYNTTSTKYYVPPIQDSINNVEGIFYTIKDTSKSVKFRFIISGTNIPIGPQNFSFVFHGENGDFEWAETCMQCNPGDVQQCYIENGIGTYSCGDDNQWSKCLVQSCNNNYNYNSISDRCEKFLSYNYIVIIVAGGTMFLIILAILIIRYMEYREKTTIDPTTGKVMYRDDGTIDDGTGVYVRPKDKEAKVTPPDLYNLVSPFIIDLVVATACSLVATAASILQPFYIGQIINDIPSTNSIGELKSKFIIIFILALIEFIFQTLSSWVQGIVNEKMIMKLQNKVFRALIAQDMGFFQKNNAAVLMNVLIVDSPMLRSALTGILLATATALCKFVGSLVFIFTISWKLSLAFFATVPVLAIVTQIQSKFTNRFTRQLLFFNSKASQKGQETMVNMHVVTNYCRQDKEIIKYTNQLMQVFKTAKKLIINNTFASSVKWLMVESLAFIILYFGAYLVIQKQFTVGLLISFSLYIGYVIDSTTTLFGIYVSYFQTLAAANRIFMILRSAPRKRTTLEEEEIDRKAVDVSTMGNDNNNNDNDSDDADDDGGNDDDDSSDDSSDSSDNEDGGNVGGGTKLKKISNIVVGEDGGDSNNNNNNNNYNSDSMTTGETTEEEEELKVRTKKQQKEKKRKDKEAEFKQTGISVIEMSLIPNSYVELNECRGEIEFKNVCFSYPTRPNYQALSNISIKFEAGKCYGVVGPSGSGKSTLLELISKFYPIECPDTPRNQGSILLDGVDIAKIRPSNLRGFVTCVHQHPYLFEATLAENIGYALENPSMDEVIEAAKMANIHEFIQELPKQYQTVLSEGGNLSGGQKKRVAVARAICAKRKIMLLDEITAELDPESEEAITNSIKKLTKGHTVVMVAHKVAAVRDCDKIFVLDKGFLVEEGTHDELMENKGKYYRMFSDDKGSEEFFNNLFF